MFVLGTHLAMNSLSLSIIGLNDYQLNQPAWLLLIPLVFLLIFLPQLIKRKYLAKSVQANLASSKNEHQIFYHPLIDIISFNYKTEKIKSTPTLFYLFILILFIIALCQPVHIGKKLPDPPKERDIIFIVDTSVSMILRDYFLNGQRIDRMTLLKGMLGDFIKQLKGERMSIIVFGDHAYTLVPLTSDQHLLQSMLARVEVTMAGRFNAIGEGIALAVKNSTQHLTQESKRKTTLVLLTDADQPTGTIEPVAAAMLAKNAQLPLYSIAIGATNIAAEEKIKGGLLYSPADLNLVKKLSGITGAESYRAENQQALNNAIQSITSHGTNIRKIKPVYENKPLYSWFLILAFLLFSFRQAVSFFPADVINRQKRS